MSGDAWKEGGIDATGNVHFSFQSIVILVS